MKFRYVVFFMVVLLFVSWQVSISNTADKPKKKTDAVAEAEKEDEISGAKEITASEELIVKIKQAKKTGIALILLSIAGLAFALERIFGLRRKAIVPAKLASQANELFKESKYDEIIELCNKHRSTLGRIIIALTRYRNCKIDEAHAIANNVGSVELKLQNQRNQPLAVIGSIAPLLGLLGTIFGMIRAFEDVSALGALGDARILAEGISEALITTAMGLVIAIPALIFYYFSKNRVGRYSIALEQQVTELIRLWFMKKQIKKGTNV